MDKQFRDEGYMKGSWRETRRVTSAQTERGAMDACIQSQPQRT